MNDAQAADPAADPTAADPTAADPTAADSPSAGAACQTRFSPGHPLPAAHDHEAGGHEGHSHDHGLSGPPAGSGTTATARHRKRLILVLVITLSIVGVQVVGALISGSLALLADAGHMLTDATGVAIALVASLLAGLPATSKRTYGYLRVEVLAALANGIVLGVIAVVIFIEAISRFGSEVEIATTPMLIAAVIGGAANLVSLLILRSGQKESLNVRGAYLEVLGDLLGSVAVIVAGVIIIFTGWNWVDQAASILIALLIVPRAFSLLREVVDVLLEATPRGFDLDAARTHMLAVPGVAEVHDVHAWVLTSGVPAFSAHVTLTEDGTGADAAGLAGTGSAGAGLAGAGLAGAGLAGAGSDADAIPGVRYHRVLDELKACLREHFGVDHTTLQIEPPGHRRPGAHRHA